MLAWKYLLMVLGVALFGSAGALVAYDIYLSEQLRRLLSRGKSDESGAEVGALARRPFRPVRWRTALQADGVRHPDGADHGRLRDDSRRSGGHTRQRVLGRASRYVIWRKEMRAARNGCANGFR